MIFRALIKYLCFGGFQADKRTFMLAARAEFSQFIIADVKQKLVGNINKLSPADLEYMLNQLEMLISKSVHDNETIDDKNVDKNFITFLIRLYY